jgi:hypothetical protein
VSVRATAGAGLSATITSRGVVTSQAPPLSGRPFLPSLNNAQASTAWWPSTTSVKVDFSKLGDPFAGVRSYSIALGGCAAAADNATVVAWRVIGNMSSTSTYTLSGGFSLTPLSSTYCVWMQAVTNLGVAIAERSAPFLVDPTPPVAGVVVDAAVQSAGSLVAIGGADAIDIVGSANITAYWYSLSSARVGAAWRGWVAPPSGIVQMYACVGSVPKSCDISNAASLVVQNGGANGSYAVLVYLRERTARTFVTVTAVAGSGLVASASSDGCTFDPFPPSINALQYSSTAAAPNGTRVDGSLGGMVFFPVPPSASPVVVLAVIAVAALAVADAFQFGVALGQWTG